MLAKQDQVIRLARVLRYNRNRINRALALFPMDKQCLFNAMPFFLHVNHPDVPGFVNQSKVPCGLSLFSYRPSVKQALMALFPENHELLNNVTEIWPKRCYIESLSLMGSIGTIAQSEKSDLDYWVCVDGSKMDAKRWQLLQCKLTIIEQWIWQEYKLEVHFFLSDTRKIRINDFGDADGESAGSAQPMFLKNEYYSTSILITGKIPFWWITPRYCTNEQYQQLYEDFQHWTEPNPQYFIDLGNLHRLKVSEMFGATIWQLTKAIDSPFKSVLKMAKLEVFIDDINNRIPLCNILKERIHQGVNLDKDIRATDSYVLLFDTIIEYYRQNYPQFLELFKICWYIKSDCRLTVSKVGESDDFKRDVIQHYVSSWNWSPSKIAHLDNIDNWEFADVNFLGNQIHSFLIGCYKRLSEKIMGEKQCVNQEDMTVFGRKIDSFYSNKKGKVNYLKRAFEYGLMQLDITIVADLDLKIDTNQRWSAYRGRLNLVDADVDNPRYLRGSSDPVELVLWCVFNHIVSSKSNFYLLQNQLAIKAADITELIHQALIDYKAIRVSEISREVLLSPCQITHCLLVVNFMSVSSSNVVETVRVIYVTSWGELYSFPNMQAFEKIKDQCNNQEVRPICRLYTPSRNKRAQLYRWIEDLFDFEFDKIM